MSIYDNIQSGKYACKLKHFTKPLNPEVLRKPAGALTADELKSIENVKEEYAAEMAAYDQNRRDYSEDQGRLDGLFFADLAAEHGVDPKDKFVDKMFAGIRVATMKLPVTSRA